MEITQCQKGFEIWLAMATKNLRECASGDVREVAALMWDRPDSWWALSE